MKSTRKNKKVAKSETLLAAEAIGQQALAKYCRPLGWQADLCRKTGLIPAVMSRMVNGKTPIMFESAVLLHVATGGELDASVLCPSRAELLAQFLGRTKQTKNAT